MGKIKNVLIFIIVILILCVVTYFLTIYVSKLSKKNIENTNEAYLSSTSIKIKLYNEDYKEIESVIRGTKVVLYEKEVDNEGIIYKKIKYNNKIYLVNADNVVNKFEDAVKEKEVYVRTSLTIYKSFDNVDIVGYSKKGTKLKVIGFDKIKDDGTVNMYKVSIDEIEGYVYSKYVVDTLEKATAVYNENGIYDYHKDRTYSFELYGGYAKNLDYYPVNKPDFENNKLLAESKTYYLTGSYYVLSEIDKYIELAKKVKANAFVVDIKDGALAYKSDISKEYSKTSYDKAMNSVEFYGNVIKKLKDEGFYVIGRIVIFNDSTYASDNPDDCIKNNNGNSTSWVSAYSRRAWEYNVKLAKESIKLFGFNEIQFDYVRFPEASYNWSKYNYDFNNKYNEEKAEAIQTFLYYATDEIHKDETYLSVDVFGESSDTYVTAYGQYWPAISNVVDVISAMPYTDHFDRNDSTYWTNPYQTVKNWAITGAARQKEIPTPAKVRTWITAYDTPYWNVTTIYGADEISAQIQALVDAGLGPGFITWNSLSSYTKYQAIAPAFNKTY